jgi:hypothetical protein
VQLRFVALACYIASRRNGLVLLQISHQRDDVPDQKDVDCLTTEHLKSYKILCWNLLRPRHALSIRERVELTFPGSFVMAKLMVWPLYRKRETLTVPSAVFTNHRLDSNSRGHSI